MAEATQRELDEVQAAMAAREFDKALRLLDEVLDASPDHGDAFACRAGYAVQVPMGGHVAYPNGRLIHTHLYHLIRTLTM